MKNIETSLPREVKVFWIALVVLSMISCISCLYCRLALHLDYPYTWPLFIPEARYTDFTIYADRFRHFHQSEFFDGPGFPFTYPAPVALIYELFYLTPAPLYCFLATVIMASLCAVSFLGKKLYERNISKPVLLLFLATLVLLSYPMAFLFDRANMEINVWIFLILGVWAYSKERKWGAATCFGIAASLKLFPIIYLGLFLAKKQYRLLFFSGAVFLVTTLISLDIVGPTFGYAVHGVSAGLSAFRNLYALQLHPSEIGFDHSLYTFIKIAEYRYHLDNMGMYLSGYIAIVALIGTALFFGIIRNLPFLNQVLLLTIAAIWLPPVSSDYTLVHLYIPFAMLTLYAMEANRAGIKVRGLLLIFIGLAIIFTPQTYLIYHYVYLSKSLHVISASDIVLGGQVKALVLFGLFIVGLKFPFPDLYLIQKGSIADKVIQ